MTFRSFLLSIFFLTFCLPTVSANDQTNLATTSSPSLVRGKLKVAVFERPPYCFRNKNGIWTGLSIDLWEQIARRLGLVYEYVNVPLGEIYEKLNAGTCDLSLALAISGEHVDQVEFTEPYLFSHGAVVTLNKSILDSLVAFSSYLGNREVIFILCAMLVGMVIFSVLLLLVEGKYDNGHFSGSSAKGFGSALWFSAVTMTTTGYGDKTPSSALGRIITFFWMLVGVLLIALFTGTVASSITTAQLKNGVVRFDDLSRFRVGCMEGSRMDILLKESGIPAMRVTTPEEGFAGFSANKITAFVGDSVTLEYVMTHDSPGKFKIAPIPDSAMIYAFAARPHLSELNEINRNLLEITLSPGWRARTEAWTGPLSF